MSEFVAHPVPADTSLADDTRNMLRSLSNFCIKQQLALTVIGVGVVLLVINRQIMRRELTHIRFVVEVYPDGVGDSWMGED